MSSLLWTLLRAWLVLSTANSLQAAEIRGWECEAAAFRWPPCVGGGRPAQRGTFQKSGAYV